MLLIQKHKIKGREDDDNHESDEEHEIGDQSTSVERLFGCGVQVRPIMFPADWPMKSMAVVVFFLVSPAVFWEDQE